VKLLTIGGVTSSKDDPGLASERLLLNNACAVLGAAIGSGEDTILVCSPFDDTADVALLRGLAADSGHCATPVEFHFVDSPDVCKRLEELVGELGLTAVTRVPYPPPQNESADARRFAWLLCQLNALECAHLTFAIGGQADGAANMLLLLAEGRRKPLLPFPFIGGAAKKSFEPIRYELEDRLGVLFADLQNQDSVKRALSIGARLTGGSSHRRSPGTSSPPKFFISYARSRQAEADYVETLLRRRNLRVFRDESDFGAGHSIPTEIREAIFSCTVFVAIWCREYACSPWCFDELELALDRESQNGLKLWILCVDDTRMVPKRARDLVHYDVCTRNELEGRVVELIARELEQR
jgi:hypothetical protein